MDPIGIDNCGWTLDEKVREVVKMLLRHIRGTGAMPPTDRMIPLLDVDSLLRLAREIIGLKLQPPNQRKQRYWKVNPDKLDQTLRAAGLDPASCEIVQPELWELAIQQASTDIQDRKALRQQRRANERKMRARAGQAVNGTNPRTMATESYRPPYDESDPYNGAVKHEVRGLPAGSVGERLSSQHLSDKERDWWNPPPVDPDQQVGAFGSYERPKSIWDKASGQQSVEQGGNGQGGNRHSLREQRGYRQSDY